MTPRAVRPRALATAAIGVALATLVLVAPPLAAQVIPPATARAIAIAEDARQYRDGALKRFLADPIPAVRARAALAVGRLQDSTAVADMLPLLDDASVEVRREAVFALGQIGHRSARAALEARLVDRDPETVDLAIEALGKLADKASTPRLTALLRSPSALFRGEAAVALWRVADSTALAPLLAAHEDPDPAVRWRVIYALEKIVAPAQIVLAVAQHLEDPDPLVRAYAARTLGRQKSARATAYLLQASGDADLGVQVNAIRALQQIGDSASARVAPTLAALLAHRNPYIRLTAATALAERATLAGADSVGRSAAFDSLVAHLKDSDAATRGACARALLARRGEAALVRVAPLLGDSVVYTRVATIEGFRTLPANSSTDAMLLRLLDPQQALFVRMTAADVLGARKSPNAVAPLRAGLADTSVLYVAACAGGLASLGDSASVAALERAYAERARDADADARIAIRDALRDLAGRSVADSVEAAHPVRNAAPPVYPDDFAETPAARGALIVTTAGEIQWAFNGREAPQTVKNFVRLAEAGYFNGASVHRVVPNFVVQDGDPTGTGSGGPGYTIRCEYNRLRYEPGMVGMALSGKDTGGSQWFITHSPQHHLDGKYTIFAHVVHGMDVVQRVVQGDRILRVEILK